MLYYSDMYPTLKDHLGSWTTITAADGTVEQELSFDAWGNRRDPENWLNTDQLPEPIFDRGFTGHEHLYTFGLINMNGLRVLCGEDTPKDYQG